MLFARSGHRVIPKDLCEFSKQTVLAVLEIYYVQFLSFLEEKNGKVWVVGSGFYAAWESKERVFAGQMLPDGSLSPASAVTCQLLVWTNTVE